MRKHRVLLIGCAAAGTLAIVVVATVVLPPLLAPSRSASFGDLAKAQSDIRGNLVAALGVLAVLVGAAVGYLNYREDQRQNRETLRIQERGQVTDRFSQAVDQLGAEGDQRLDVRMGGIFGLAEIARDAPSLHWPIMQLLTAYIRERSWELVAEAATVTRLRPDLQAATEVIASQERDLDRGRLDLRTAVLPAVELHGNHVRLEGAHLSNAHLKSASFRDAHMDGADLRDADVSDACFVACSLRAIDMRGAVANGAGFDLCDLEDARWQTPATPLAASISGEEYHPRTQLTKARFCRARLPRARFGECHLSGANFSEAKLAEAYFWDAQLAGSSFELADLKGAYFGGTKTDLSDAVFRRAVLVGAVLTDTNVLRTDFGEADAAQATFDNAHGADARFDGLQGVATSFRQVQLEGGEFGEANLEGAVFWNANLAHARFFGARLQASDFTGADLQEASFADAILDAATFSTVRLDGQRFDAAGLTPAQLAEARSLHRVTLPSYLDPEEVEAIRAAVRKTGKSPQST